MRGTQGDRRPDAHLRVGREGRTPLRDQDRESQDGAFGLWRVGDGEADPWLGAYATDFLLEAKAQGAAVPQSAIDAALQLRAELKGDVSQVTNIDIATFEASYNIIGKYPEAWARIQAPANRIGEYHRPPMANFASAAKSLAGIGTQSATWAMPALPGAA